MNPKQSHGFDTDSDTDFLFNQKMEFQQVGFTKKAHGLGGELKLQIEPKFIEDVLKADVIFIEMRGQKIPQFIEKIREGNAILVKFEDIKNRSQAEEMESKAMFLRAADILDDDEREIETDDDGLQFEFAIGFRIIDSTLGDLGEIVRIEEFPQQEMAFIFHNKNEVMIPLNEAFLIEIDEENRQIRMDLPEGLL